MSETREPEYVVLDWDDDFKLDANVDSTGEQRFALMGYIQKRRVDGIYQAPIIPELFYGVNGAQLHTWRQNFTTTGEQTILRRDSGNPFVSDSELAWRKVSEAQQRQRQPAQPSQAVQRLEIPVVPILALIGIPLGLYLLYKTLGKVAR